MKYIAKTKNIKITEIMYSQVLIQTDLKFKNKLFESIGRGFLSKKDLDALFKKIESSFVKNIFSSKDHNQKINVTKYENGIAINFAACCSPIKGDDIISVMSYGRGLVVHSTMCDSL